MGVFRRKVPIHYIPVHSDNVSTKDWVILLEAGTIVGPSGEKLRVAQEDNHSPDLTHYRIVKKGDTLPMMCFLVYGDARYYLQVARANKLINFRKLNIGDELFFPPFAKTATD